MPVGAFCAFLGVWCLVRYFTLFLGHATVCPSNQSDILTVPEFLTLPYPSFLVVIRPLILMTPRKFKITSSTRILKRMCRSLKRITRILLFSTAKSLFSILPTGLRGGIIQETKRGMNDEEKLSERYYARTVWSHTTDSGQSEKNDASAQIWPVWHLLRGFISHQRGLYMERDSAWFSQMGECALNPLNSTPLLAYTRRWDKMCNTSCFTAKNAEILSHFLIFTLLETVFMQ